ncbi:MAG: VCBS repeat-containing protein [Verrucomicrobia bacterium]|nr:VCBS repeat-containing protein [Verrucomicrobiota bacterium]
MTPIQVGIPGVGQGSLAWGDYDRDGFVDVVVTGSTQPGPPFLVTRVYRSRGDASFGDAALPLPGVYEGSASWVDFDNDGALDLFITGITDTFAATARNIAALFRISRDGSITEVHTDLPGAEWGSADWADYDRDGDLDLVLTDDDSAAVFRNDGAGRFVDAVVPLPAVGNPAVSWGDLDADGQPDLLLAGDGVLAVFRNHGDGVFSGQDTGYALAYEPSIALGDYDNDGDLDILSLDWGEIRMVWYRKNSSRTNTPPRPPERLSTTLELETRNHVSFHWSAAQDAETVQAAGLTYNLRVGTVPGGVDIVSPPARATDGSLQVPGPGVHHGLQARLLDLAGGTYYWSVQAVDAGLRGSTFAGNGSFTAPNRAPTISPIANQGTLMNQPLTNVSFTIGDRESPASALELTVQRWICGCADGRQHGIRDRFAGLS